MIAKDKACTRWIDRFSCIPISLVKSAYRNKPERLHRISKRSAQENGKYLWNWVFCPKDVEDQYWIEQNIQQVEEAGFLVYFSDDCGILLAVDGYAVNDDFVERYWMPLYRLRGFEQLTEKRQAYSEDGIRQSVPAAVK